jgi:hypothetical protein
MRLLWSYDMCPQKTPSSGMCKKSVRMHLENTSHLIQLLTIDTQLREIYYIFSLVLSMFINPF